MPLRRPLTEAEKEVKRRAMLKWWAENPRAAVEKKKRGVRLAAYNRTRTFSDKHKRAMSVRITNLNKTRVRTQAELTASAERMSRLRRAKVIQRGPQTDEERELHRLRLLVNNPMKQEGTRLKMRASILANMEALQAAAIRMREFNPMFDPQIAKRAAKMRMERHGERLALQTRWLHFMGRMKPWLNLHIRPTRPEKELTLLLEPLGFRYTGDSQFWIGPCKSGTRRNPDFVWRSGRKKVALLYNGKYWHERRGDDEIELADYDNRGWRVFVVSEEMFQDKEATVASVGLWLAGLGLSPSR